MGDVPMLNFRHGLLDLGDSKIIPKYAPGSGLFSIRFHFGGNLIHSPSPLYVGGTVLIADNCSVANLDLKVFDNTSRYLGYGSPAMCVFVDPILGLAGGINDMVESIGFREFICAGVQHGCIDVLMLGECQNFLTWFGENGTGTNVVDGTENDGTGTNVVDGTENDVVVQPEKKKKKKKQGKGMNTSQGSGKDKLSNQYYSNLARDQRQMRRKLKSRGQFQEYKSTGPQIPLREVDGVFLLDDEEPESMDEASGPPCTQPTQPVATEASPKKHEKLPDAGGSPSTQATEAKEVGVEQPFEDDAFWEEVDRSARAKVEQMYQKNIAELEAKLQEMEGKRIATSPQVSDQECEKEGEGSRKRKCDDVTEPNEEVQYNAGDSDDDVDVGPRFVDSDFEVDDDEDLDDLLKSRKLQWTGVQETGDKGKDMVDSDPEWHETGDEYESDGLYSLDSESDGDANNDRKGRARSVNRFVLAKEYEDVRFDVGQVFISRAEFQTACRHHGTMQKRKIRFRRSNRRRCTAFCTNTASCPWMVSVNFRASSEFWELTRMVPIHKCGPVLNHGCADYKYLAQRLKGEIQIMPNISIAQLVDKIKRDLHIVVSRDVAKNARRVALESILVDWKEQYVHMKAYCDELRRSNPGSTVILQTEKNAANRELFRRIYVCFAACKKGFVEGCRPLLGMDGCHLTGSHKGILLAAIGMDANDQIFPVAYAVVEVECTSSWLCFLTLLRDDLGINNSKQWTLLTDKQKGLRSALNELFPAAEHRMCTWHLYKNFKGTYASLELKEMLWAAAKCTHENQWKRQMQRIKDANPGAYEWLMQRDRKSWARAFFHTESKCDILVNNICECFNRVILHARDKPILTLLEAMRFYFMDRLQKKRVFISRITGPLGPKVAQKLEACMSASNQWFSTHSGDHIYEVRNYAESKYEVRLGERTCSCRKWQLTGIPCAHAVAAIAHTKEEPVAFVDAYYSKEMYQRAYKYIIYPVNGPELWEMSEQLALLPPRDIRLPGRPAKARKKGLDEKLEVKNKKMKKLSRAGKMKPYKCGKCNQPGHTVKKCPTKTGSSSQAQAPEEPIAQPSTVHVEKKVRNVRACSICKQTGHNKSTCRVKVSERYQNPCEKTD